MADAAQGTRSMTSQANRTWKIYKIATFTFEMWLYDRCLVLEDSVTGLTAALAAGMAVVAVANPFSAPYLRAQTRLPQEQVRRTLIYLFD